MKWVPIIDAGIAARDYTPIYQSGLEKDVFIKINKNQTLIG